MISTAVNALLIESNTNDAHAILKCLGEIESPRFIAQHVTQIESAIPLLGQGDIDIVIASLDQAQGDLFSVLSQAAPQIPILVLSSLADTHAAIRFVRGGAQDYLIKGQLHGRTIRRVALLAIERQARVTESDATKLKHQRELEKQAIIDDLTGLYNRRHLRERLIHEMFRSERYGSPLCLLLLDLDNFKRVNDAYGHTFGDSVLAMAASLIKNRIRVTDIAARYGGEEFCILLTETKLEGAMVFAEHLRKLMETTTMESPSGEPVGVTCSIGIALYEKTILDTPAFIKRADKGLYAAKRAGRNRICVWMADE